MRNFEGTVRVRIHPVKGLMLDKGVSGSTLTAADAAKVLSIALDAADKQKVGFDRWSFYLPGINEKLKKEVKTIPSKVVAEAVKEGAWPMIRAGKFSNPVMVIAKPTGEVKRESKIVDIA
jgi:hypothetical protein